MEVEDDDISALRTAALASRSAKQENIISQDEEEDLSALRLAALMTRKQNQKIPVISQRPAGIQPISTEYRSPIETHLPLPPRFNSVPVPMPMSLPPPPLRPGNPLQMTVPPPPIPLPEGIIRLGPPPDFRNMRGPPPPAPGQLLQMRNSPPPNFIHMREPPPMPPNFHRLQRPPQVPFQGMRETAPRHSQFHRMRPPLLPTPGLRESSPRSNLISLTPGPNNTATQVNEPRISHGQPRPHSGQRFQTRHVRPSSQRHHQRHCTPVVEKLVVAPEPKVPTKFDRYDNSSSDEDDEHTAVDKKANSDDNDDDENEESDAESAVSEKSFSSVSVVDQLDTAVGDVDIAEASDDDKSDQENVENKDSDSSSENDTNVVETEHASDDNISIHDPNEEDDILAAIDDFLEDRPEKVKEKKPQKETVDKNESTILAKKTDSKEQKKTTAKPKPIKASMEKISITSKGEEESTKPKKGPSKTLQNILSKRDRKEQNRNGTEPLTKFNKISCPTPDPPVPTVKPQSTKSGRENIRIPPVRQDVIQHATHPALPPTDIYTIPVAVTQGRFSPPRRGRRDSDLDSVGTSDLSFLSSESEDEVKNKKTEVKQPQRRPRTRSMSGNNEDKVSRPRDTERSSQRRRKDDRRSPPQNENPNKSGRQEKSQSSRNSQNSDLRKKLENRGISKKTDSDIKTQPPKVSVSTKNLPKSQRALSPVRKSGVISLKKKSSRIPPPQPKERSSSRSNSSREASPNNISLPDLNEARRIVITRPNTSIASSKKKNIDEKQSKNIKNRTMEHSRRFETENTSRNRRSASFERKRTKQKIEMKEEDKEDSPIPRNRRRSVLPPKSDKDFVIVENKTRKRKDTATPSNRKTQLKKQETPPSSESSSNEEDSSEKDVNSDIEEEEVFVVDDGVLPDFDDVLGNFDEEDGNDVGEYVISSKKSRKLSQTKLKKPRKEKKQASVRHIPDSRRIIPKSSPPPEDEQVEIKKTKKSVHERLGRLANTSEPKRRALPSERFSKSVRRRPSPKWESDAQSLTNSSDDTESESGEESSDLDASREKKSSGSVSSSVRVAARMKRVFPGDELYEKTFRKTVEKGNETETKHRKRKILVSGRKEGSSAKTSRGEETDKTTKKLNVKDRLGKVILSSVLNQQSAPKSTSVVPSKSKKTESRESGNQKSEKRRKRERDPKPDKKEDVLEAKIQRIKEKNSRIMKRQKEIQKEKEKYGF